MEDAGKSLPLFPGVSNFKRKNSTMGCGFTLSRCHGMVSKGTWDASLPHWQLAGLQGALLLNQLPANASGRLQIKAQLPECC